MTDFHTETTIHCSTHACYTALTQQVTQWWSSQFEGSAATVGDRFTVRFDGTHKSFVVEELVPDARVIWRCTDSYLDVTDFSKKSEWNDTRILWSMKAAEEGTQLSVTHEGLTPEVQCYTACEQGWNHFFYNSLVPYLEQGKGAPYLSQRGAA